MLCSSVGLWCRMRLLLLLLLVVLMWL